MNSVKIVFSDWAGFPLYRKRKLDGRDMDCGLGHILDNARKYVPGINFDALLVINESSDPPSFLQRVLVKFGQKPSTGSKRDVYGKLPEKYPFLKEVLFRDNKGQDFGAYNFAYQHLKKTGYQGDVLLLNSSLEGPFADGWLKKYHNLFRSRSDVGLCGISLHSHNTNIRNNPPFAPHVGSYLLYTNMATLSKVFPNGICGADTDDKNEIIAEGEIGASREILDAGYSICACAHPGFYYKQGGTWDVPVGALPSNRRI